MELYDSEEQQVEAIKAWWKENGTAIIIGSVVGLGGLFGWRYYQDTVLANQEALSEQYTKAIEPLASAEDADLELITTFINDNGDKEYSVLAAMQLAKVQAESGESQAALETLQQAYSATKDDTIKSLIALRITRLMASFEQYDQALEQLTTVSQQGWSGKVAELRGDILLRKGDRDAARTAYVEAQQSGQGNQLLQMKLDDLAE